MVYLDHNATTPVRPEAAEAVADALMQSGNPSSVHRHGRVARRVVEDARERVAAMVGADGSEVVFTAGGTEANAMALNAFSGQRVMVSAVEHVSVLAAAGGADRIAVDQDGRVDPAALDEQLAGGPEPSLVSVMLANNETGAVQPIQEIVEVAHRHGARVHCDAAQGPGRIAVDVAELGVDLLTLSGHKLGAPTGVGALIVVNDMPIAALSRGGGQERGRRAGTENVAGIAGFGAAAEATVADTGLGARLERLRDDLEQRILAVAPETPIAGAGARRLPNTSCFALPSVPSETQVMALDLAGVSVSAGAACSSGKVARSHVLAAMGWADDLAGEAIRVSLGWTSTQADVDRFVAAWQAMRAHMNNNHPVPSTSAA